jgi:ABC-2 type transport system permease protein
LHSRSTAVRWLLAKEWRQLLASRAWWIMLVLTGPLVGVSFISSVNTYAEASGLGGTTAGIGQAFSPLTGIWSPSFSAFEVAAVFLLPFVAIKMMAADRQSGALKLELQQAMPAGVSIAAKALVLFCGWMIGFAAAAAAVVLWKTYGGSIYPPEVAAVLAGHSLNAGLTIAFGAAAAAMTEHPSTAAILTFSFTVGTWVLDFVAALEGGIWERLAGYTPAAMVAEFQRGLVRMDVILTAFVITLSGLALAAVWTRLGVSIRRRTLESLLIGGVTVAAVIAASAINVTWDVSENRQNSFSVADEEALAQIKEPLRIEVHLAPQDPRRVDLERQGLAKVRRVMPDVRVRYISSTSTGLFEQTTEHYGEVSYELGGRKAMNRLTTEEGVLETIFDLAKVKPVEEDKLVFAGHPLAAPPKGAAVVFYGVWPALIAGGIALIARWRNT